MELALRLIAGAALVAANAFFVAVEFALTRLPDLDLDRDEVDDPGLQRALGMLDRLEIHLTGCQLGISTTSVLLGVIAEPAVTQIIEPVVGAVGITGGSVHGVSVVVAVVIINLLHKIWGEQAPTYLGVERPREVAARLAPVLSWWSRIMHPVIKLGDGLAKATLRLFGVEITRSWAEAEVGEGAAEGDEGMGDAERPTTTSARPEGKVENRAELKRRMARLLTSAGDMPRDRRDEVMQALEIDDIPARRVMVPADRMVTLDLDADPEENRARLARSGHVRYPVVRGGVGDGHHVADGGRGGGDGRGGRTGERSEDRDAGQPGRGDAIPRERVVGVLYVPRLFDPPERLRQDDLGLAELVEEPVYLDADLPVATLIDRLQEASQEVALLVDDGGVVGMVTVTDALEAIAGEVTDPLD